MKTEDYTSGAFTLPGEAGYEDLTLKLCKTWGADTIRDSDGTQLSGQILESGYDIYSTICLVRLFNDWLKENRHALQQTYLLSFPVLATSNSTVINPLNGYFDQQFSINIDDDPQSWWQVYDRTAGSVVDPSNWKVLPGGQVQVESTIPWHRYTVTFLVYRIWDEISMYNHVTNDWGDREHQMPADPIHPDAREQILHYLDVWLKEHPHTNVVRFTSMFYNFFWPWADGKGRKFILNDWGSYEFSVSPAAIKLFEKMKGYRPQPEDFVNGGRFWSSHAVPTPFYRDWMEVMHRFVVQFGKTCVKKVQEAGKKAYVFYNDHWIGLEPTLPSFEEVGFDGIIDGIFSGFEARKVADTKGVKIREIRMHPYFFPTGVNGEPSFLPGGNPTEECQRYWIDIRRALLREPVDRMGFGGYLHLVENHPDFVDYVKDLAIEFRKIRRLHSEGAPFTAPLKVAFLTAWGQQRAWGCCGHFNRDNYYNEAMESLSGLPVKTSFLGFKDVLKDGIPVDLDIIINAGNQGDAWSGGSYWENPDIISAMTEWIHKGGGFIGIGEPSAAPLGNRCFRLADAFGVDKVLPVARNLTPFSANQLEASHFLAHAISMTDGLGIEIDQVKVIDPDISVVERPNGSVKMAINTFGSGRTVYLSGYKHEMQQVRLLHRILFWAAGKEDEFSKWSSENPATECAWFPGSSKLVVVNNSDIAQDTSIKGINGTSFSFSLKPHETRFQQVSP